MTNELLAQQETSGRTGDLRSGSSGAGFMAGAAAVALLLFGTRWGSYLGFGGSIYFTDVLIAIAVVIAVLRSASERSRGFRPTSGHGWTGLLIALLAYVVVRLISGGDFSFTAIRDAAPYIYSAVGLLSFYSIRRLSREAARNTVRVFIAALTLHALWYAAQLLIPALPAALPFVAAEQGLHVFTARPDVDSTYIGVLAAMILWRVLRRPGYRILLLLCFVACWGMIAASFTRAGLLGALLATSFVVLLAISDPKRSWLRRSQLAAVVVIGIVGGLALVGTSEVGTKFIATVDPSATGTSAVGEGAAGTAKARSNAWTRLVEWNFEDQQRAVVGVGFGPDFLVDSGASLLLVSNDVGGDTVPRSPHDYWLGSMARLGVIGLGLLVLVVGQFLVRVWKLRRRAREEPLQMLVLLIGLSLLIPASLGVVLESPFAAVPFWWAVGAALGSAAPVVRRLGAQSTT